MIKPAGAVAGAIAILGTGIAGAVYIASSGGEEEAVRLQETPTPTTSASPSPAPIGSPSATPAASPTPTPVLSPAPMACELAAPPGTTLWRWLNVTVLLPDEPGFQAFPQTIPAEVKPPEGGAGLDVRQFDPSNNTIYSSMLIDAETGTVIRDDVRPEHTASLQQAKSTVAICPFDPAKAPWPYNGEPPAGATRESLFGLSVIRPDPQSGIYIEFHVGATGQRGEATPPQCQPAGQGIAVYNAQSTGFIWVDANTGALCTDLLLVLPADLAAFERFVSDVKRCGKDTEC